MDAAEGLDAVRSRSFPLFPGPAPISTAGTFPSQQQSLGRFRPCTRSFYYASVACSFARWPRELHLIAEQPRVPAASQWCRGPIST